MLSGIITRLLPTQGLGYVRPVAGGVAILFRALAVEGDAFAELTEGQAVTYSLERDLLGRGPRATQVRPVPCPTTDASPVH